MLLSGQPGRDGYQAFARELFAPAVQRTGWDAKPGEGHLDALLRTTVLSQAGSYGDPNVLDQAKARFAEYIEDPGALHPDLRGVVLSLTGQTGGRATYDQLWQLEKDAQLQESLDLAGNTERPRRLSLVEQGLVISTLRRRPTPSGRTAMIWIASEYRGAA